VPVRRGPVSNPDLSFQHSFDSLGCLIADMGLNILWPVIIGGLLHFARAAPQFSSGGGGGNGGNGGSGSGSNSGSSSSSSCPQIWSTIASDLRSSFQGCNNNARSSIRFAFHDAGTLSLNTFVDELPRLTIQSRLLFEESNILACEWRCRRLAPSKRRRDQSIRQ
jgi:hypothetical protein